MFRRAILVCLAACGASPVTTARAPLPSTLCGPEIPNEINAPLILLGEMHGQVGSPAFAVDLACREAVRAGHGTLALEIPQDEQPGIDAFLAGGPKEALLAGAFWTRPAQDGRSSVAMLHLLEEARRLQRAGVPLAIRTIDATNEKDRDAAMAKVVLGLPPPAVVLTGNYHTRVVVVGTWNPDKRWMGVQIREQRPDVVALDVRYGAGEGWTCQGMDDECGLRPMRGNGDAPAFLIDRTARPEGFHGTYAIGVATASPPAIGTTAADDAFALASRFRAVNKPTITDGVPGESSLSADERASFCQRIMPVAHARLAMTGDRLEDDGPCAIVVTPAHAVVPDVKVRFDLGFFARKPYATASYDDETRTLYLPLDAIVKPWADRPSVHHEWLHAHHHARARAGDPTAMALMTVSRGPDYRPDGFFADEVPVNQCHPSSREMTEQYAKILRTELDAMKVVTKTTPRSRAGVPGFTLASTDGVERWLGGKDRAKSLEALEKVWRNTSVPDAPCLLPP